jgi:metal-dependent amidase/aminoacylase/carboxypeptidase family protein
MSSKKVSIKANQTLLKLRDGRRDFHQHPELGLNVNRTSRIVADYLEKTGIAVTTIIPYLILMRPAW